MTRLRTTALSAALLALLAGAAAAATNLTWYKKCGPTGNAKSHCGQEINRLKNRYRAVQASSINPAVTMSAILAPDDDLTRWSSNDAATVTAFVASVEHGGFQESCNCERKDLQDVHINLVADPADAGHLDRYVIAEITPRMQALHPTWTYSWAKKSLEKHWVRITGWMMFDGIHSRESLHTKDEPQQQCGDLPVKEIWRATAWEIHPVTAIEIVPAP